jgi:hypothetical protein
MAFTLLTPVQTTTSVTPVDASVSGSVIVTASPNE